jgi:hypothetical protein
MGNRAVHLGVYDTLTDSEVGHLLVELHTGRFTGTSFDVVAVAEASESITTMGGLRISPDILLDDLDPRGSDLLILPGAEVWDAGGGGTFAAAAARFVDVGVPVGLASERTLEAYEALFDRGDQAAFPVLMERHRSK